MRKLNNSDIVITTGRTDRTFVVGGRFGPTVLVVGGSAENALAEFSVRECQEVEADDPALADYEGGIEGALEAGDVRWTDDGLRWVDHYEWLREFTGRDAVRRAGRFWRGDEEKTLGVA